MDRHLVDEGVARAVQSIGIVVDYLTDRGLVDRKNLREHVERHFALATGSEAPDRSGLAIDIYGWLTWSEASKLRVSPSRWLGEGCYRLGAGGAEPSLTS
ncbi:hypothetical protein FHU13_003804 [Methylobacterium sp. R2-1]|nr:hypothetical protein [Methylobacterium sp. R2-1]